jgi:hypothetical protein
MSISSIQLQLLAGNAVPAPVPAILISALQSVEVTQSETSGFQLGFRVERKSTVSSDFQVIASELLQPGNRVIVCVTVNVMPRVLMDGIITQHQFSYENTGAMLFTITGEDISMMMDLVDLPFAYPGMGDGLIVLAVLAKYTFLGIVPYVIPPVSSAVSLPIERIPQQNTTDRKYLKLLAAENNNVFFVQPGPAPMTNFAYWGPVAHIGLPQKALSVDMGPETNVESINFSYNALAPESDAPLQIFGAVSDETSESILPFATLTSTRLPPLSSKPPWIFNQPYVLKRLMDYQGSSYLDAMMRAQAITNQSADSVVTADGKLNVLRYGDILTAPGLVGLRGVGNSYDGYYYVRSVTHHINVGQYTQDFSLAREGLGSLTMGVV